MMYALQPLENGALGQAKGMQDFICLFIGTGIGGGIVSGGKLIDRIRQFCRRGRSYGDFNWWRALYMW